MGKTHMVEFAFGPTGRNAHYGSPRNPWDATAHREPGGSSSGAGVSLCEGSALLAFGSDTAASVRLPAAMTGNAGLKFTKDRWTSERIVPLSFTLDTPGILARSVADAAFSFAALDPHLGDGFAFLRRVPTSVDGIRIGIADSWFWDGCENGIGEIVRSAIDSLARAGAAMKDKPFPEAREAFAVFVEGGVSAIELRTFLDRELPDWLATIDPVNAPALKNAENLSAREYLARRLRLLDLAKSAVARFDDVDVIAAPTAMFTPCILTERLARKKSGRAIVTSCIIWRRRTIWHCARRPCLWALITSACRLACSSSPRVAMTSSSWPSPARPSVYLVRRAKFWVRRRCARVSTYG